MKKQNHLIVEPEYVAEINRYCTEVKKKTGIIKRRIITSLLLEAIRRDLAGLRGQEK